MPIYSMLSQSLSVSTYSAIAEEEQLIYAVAGTDHFGGHPVAIESVTDNGAEDYSNLIGEMKKSQSMLW